MVLWVSILAPRLAYEWLRRAIYFLSKVLPSLPRAFVLEEVHEVQRTSPAIPREAHFRIHHQPASQPASQSTNQTHPRPKMALPATIRAYEARALGEFESVVAMNDKVPLPSIKPNQVLVRIASSATNPIDADILENSFIAKWLLPEDGLPSESNPMRVGLDFAGTIAKVGEGATSSFQVGDAVYGFPSFHAMGAFAEYLAINANCVAHKPKNLSFNEAAAVPGVAETSYQALVDAGKLQAGERVLILGGSSATGGFAIQIAKALGATVIATTSIRNVDLVQSLGADQVVNYTSEDWADILEPHSIDLIYDCGVETDSWNDRAQRVLKKDTGRFATIGQPTGIKDSLIGATHLQVYVESNSLCLDKLSLLIEQGKVKPTIDSVFSFEQLPAAVAKQKTKRARGKIIVEIDTEHNGKP